MTGDDHLWRGVAGAGKNEHCQECRYGRDIVPPGPCTGPPLCANCGRHLDDHSRTADAFVEACSDFTRRHTSKLHHALDVLSRRCDGNEDAEHALDVIRQALREQRKVSP